MKKLNKHPMLEQRVTKIEAFISIGVLAGRVLEEDVQTVITADPEVDAWFDEQE